jgi:hypothetical protein
MKRIKTRVEESKKFNNSKRQHWRAFPRDGCLLEAIISLLISENQNQWGVPVPGK